MGGETPKTLQAERSGVRQVSLGATIPRACCEAVLASGVPLIIAERHFWKSDYLRDQALPEESSVESVWEGGPRIASRILFEILTTQPGIGIVVLNETNHVAFTNDAAARMCLCTTAEAVVGRLVDDLFPPTVAAEICETGNMCWAMTSV